MSTQQSPQSLPKQKRPSWWSQLDPVSKATVVLVSAFGSGIFAASMLGLGGVSKESFAAHLQHEAAVHQDVQILKNDVEHHQVQLTWTNQTLWEMAQRDRLHVPPPPSPTVAAPSPSPTP